jgi:hypothetical protein
MNRENERSVASERVEEIPSELSELLAELEADRGVQLSLDVPTVRQPGFQQQPESQGNGKRQGVVIPEVKPAAGKGVMAGPMVIYRDSSDVKTILNLTHDDHCCPFGGEWCR